MISQTGIDKSNWNIPPNNRISFQYMQSLFPTRRLVRHAGEAFSFEHRPVDVMGLSFQRADGSTATVARMLEDSYTDSFLVVKSGAIVEERYYNGMHADSHHLLNSVTKSFVGALMGIAVEKGSIDVDARVSEYLPELSGPGWHGTTVRHLLDMTAGASYAEDYTDPETDFWKESSVVGWKPPLPEGATASTLLEYAALRDGKDQTDGALFHYKTLTTNVLGLLISRVLGEDLGDILTRELWSRLKTRNDANVVVDPAGNLYVGAGMSASTRDLACFGMMIANGGRLGGVQVVPRGWIDDTLRGEACSHENFMASDYAGLGCDHYRNQFWVKDAKQGVLLALGIHGQIVYMDCSSELVIVKLSTQPEAADLDVFMEAFAAMDVIADRLRS
ncbi:MAG: serine hydrolase [Halieaceae bacterium]|jgi:CubicO group peptidase (beta-lactamase class C family)|nr:serine hydrolase [Halieaceae bacterium]